MFVGCLHIFKSKKSLSQGNSFKQLLYEIKIQLEGKLPGMKAQLEMTPLPDVSQRFNDSKRKLAKQSAVLIMLYEHDGVMKFPLIERQKYFGVHSGQISLPGGKYENSDTDMIETALRETSEEIGVSPKNIQVLGTLTELYVPPSNFNILPVIGLTHEPPKFKIEEKEVKQIVVTDVSVLNDYSVRSKKKVAFANKTKMTVPFFDIQGHVVWGATAMILSEFAAIIKKINDKK